MIFFIKNSNKKKIVCGGGGRGRGEEGGRRGVRVSEFFLLRVHI